MFDNNRGPSLRSLMAFASAARHSSFRRAAAELSLTQSAAPEAAVQWALAWQVRSAQSSAEGATHTVPSPVKPGLQRQVGPVSAVSSQVAVMGQVCSPQVVASRASWEAGVLEESAQALSARATATRAMGARFPMVSCSEW